MDEEAEYQKKTLRDAANLDTYIQWWRKDDKVEGFMTLDKSKESRSLQINDELEVQLYKKDVQWSTLAYIVDVKFKEDGVDVTVSVLLCDITILPKNTYYSVFFVFNDVAWQRQFQALKMFARSDIGKVIHSEIIAAIVRVQVDKSELPKPTKRYTGKGQNLNNSQMLAVKHSLTMITYHDHRQISLARRAS